MRSPILIVARPSCGDYLKGMRHAKLTADGSVTLPTDVQEALQLVPGGEVAFEQRSNGDVVLLHPQSLNPPKRTGDIRSLKGILPKPPRALTIEEMDDAIGRAVVERYLRSKE